METTAAHLYASGKGKAESCRLAGFKDTRSYRIFDTPRVILEIEKIRELARKEISIELKDVLDGLMDGVQAAQNTADLVMAWREIGKIIGAYEHAKKIEIDVKHVKVENVKQLERMSDEDLAQLAELGDSLVIEGDYDREGD